MKAGSALLLVVALLLAAPARAEIYQWTDERGTLHFTGDLARVPAEHRAEAWEGSRRPSELRRIQHCASVTPIQQIALLRHSPEEEVIRIPFERDGNLMRVSVRLNESISVPFYVDTGSTDIMIPEFAAEDLGLRIESDTPTGIWNTPSGPLEIPIVNLESVQLGSATVSNLLGAVNPMLEVGLLGASFLDNFQYSVDTSENVLVLKPHD